MFSTFPDWIFPSAISVVLTFVVTWIIFIVRNRRVLLTYHVTHDRIGMSALDKIHGNVAVTVGGNPVQNLFMSNIWLVNRSMCDVENLEVKIFCRVDDMQLMSEQTHIEGTVDVLKHTTEFEEITCHLSDTITEVKHAEDTGDYAKVQALHQIIDSQWPTWATGRWYAVPVLTRGQTIRFTYMTNVSSKANPEIFISCQKAGVRLKYKEPYQLVWHLWGVSLSDAAFAGIIIAAAVAILVIYSISTLWLAALICLIVGLICNVFGAGVVKLYRWIWNQVIG